jgi:hypothetical protein
MHARHHAAAKNPTHDKPVVHPGGIFPLVFSV